MSNDSGEADSNGRAETTNTSDERKRSGVAVGDGTTDEFLAAVVDKPHVDPTLESLRAEGVYDDDRRIREYDADTVALPITAPPENTHVLEVVRQIDPEFRTRTLEDVLAEWGWDERALESAPKSWAVIGSVVLVRLPEDCPDETEVGKALLEVHGEASSVLADEGIETDGERATYRVPRTRLLAGDRDTETVHVEHGTAYGFDPSRVMFSPGNQAERARMGEVVEPGERVFDMFAGIGYFTLPMARAGATVTATEINPTAFRYLLENAVRNEVTDRLDAYRADCRDLAERVSADRVVMGYYGVDDSSEEDGEGSRREEAIEFLEDALEALEPGGVIHYHEATPESLLWDRPRERLEAAITEAGRECEILERRRVKSHSAGVAHVVLDVRVF